MIKTNKKKSSKIIRIFAGPNGSGKSSVAESFYTNKPKDSIFINPDKIAAGISPNNSQFSTFQACRIMIHAIHENLEKNKSFSFESTLSGKTWVKLLQQAQSQDYEIEICFIFLKNIALNMSRIKNRVLNGGHYISDKDVKRRHPRCFENFSNMNKTDQNDFEAEFLLIGKNGKKK